MINSNLKFIDLFAGIGGFHYGLSPFADCVFTSELDPKARISYLANHSTPVMNTDITKIDSANISTDIPDHNILCAGFPCQPFSVMGRREGIDDIQGRGTLIFNIIEILKAKQPDCFFLENVKNLLLIEKGETFKQIVESLENSGYYVTTKVLNSLTHGNVPQNRERVFIVGFKDKESFLRFAFPNPVTLDKKTDDILEPPDEVPLKLRHNIPHLASMVEGYIYSNRYGNVLRRHNQKGICPTLLSSVNTSSSKGPLVRDSLGTRRLTPREYLRLQGFPESFMFPEEITLTQAFKLVGNSVTVGVVQRIAENIYNSLTFRDFETNIRRENKTSISSNIILSGARQLALF
jgi:DNA (cytosine-5)-methyltransferase 1